MESQWSPDGRHILFDSKRSGNSDIWIKSSKGEQPIHVTLDPADDVRPSWSNDGSKIAFGSSRSGNMDIWIKDIDGFWSES